jgi:trans-2,3-dihydro-3-hydroxyanthranilate isomerase
VSRLPFRLIDVFTDRRFAGNPLAVVLEAEGLGEDTMQTIAREFNLSETTFVSPSTRPDCQWRVRIFTPARELPMAGHPVVGTALILAREGLAGEQVWFELGVGPTPVVVGEGRAEMLQGAPEFGSVQPDRSLLARALSLEGVSPAFIAGLPAQIVSCGVPYLIVPIASLDVMKSLRPRPELWAQATQPMAEGCIYAFARGGERPGTTAHCRMLGPLPDNREDPATGSAAGPLAAYLSRQLEVREDPMVFEQGFEMGRPSIIEATIRGDGQRITGVHVGGQGRFVGEGWLELP